MTQDYTPDCYDPDHAVNTDMSNIEKNFATILSLFSGSSAPGSPVAGQWWADSSSTMIKVRNRNNNTWLSVYNYGTGEVQIASTIRNTTLIKDQAIDPSSCTIKTAASSGGGGFPSNYGPQFFEYSTSTIRGYRILGSTEADIPNMATQVNVTDGQVLSARVQIDASESNGAGNVRFVIGSVSSNTVSVGSGSIGWAATTSATASGSGWKTLKWRGSIGSPGVGTAYVLANTISLG